MFMGKNKKNINLLTADYFMKMLNVTLDMLGKVSAGNILKYFYFFLEKMGFDISWKLFETMRVKCIYKICLLIFDPGPAEPKYTLPLQTV